MRELLGLLLLCISVSSAAQTSIPAARQQELLHLLHHDCGSCHGMRMTGGLGPALTPQTLAQKSQTFLQRTILQGREGTPMPPWNSVLSQQEAAWLVQQLQQGLGYE